MSLRPEHGLFAEPVIATGLAGWVQHMIAQDWVDRPEVWEQFSRQLSEALYDCTWVDDDDLGDADGEDFSAENGDVSDVVMPEIAATLSFVLGARAIVTASRPDRSA
jgi:hypothetical protein